MYRGRHHRKRRHLGALALAGVAVVVIAAGGAQAFASTDAGVPPYLTDHLAACKADQKVAASLTEQAWAETCADLAQRALDAYVMAHPTSTPTVVPTATSPGTTPTPGAAWPGAASTGVPAGTALTAYAGPCVITKSATVIDSKTVNCNLIIQALGVVIVRSLVNGTVSSGSGLQAGRSFAIADSEVSCAAHVTCIGESNYTLTRVNGHGGNRIANCFSTCTVQGSWLHGVRMEANDHGSAMRAGMLTSVLHNTLSCDSPNVPGGGCSADLTMYPDFSPVHDVTVTGNHFTDPHAYYHAYGGIVPGKAYSGDPANATNVRFKNNVFDRLDWFSGGPVAGFDGSRAGNVWSGNTWSPDGRPA